MMKKITDLSLGFSDAENYKRRENKDLLNRIFIRNSHLDKLCEPSVSFLIGEKGTGKTAYSVYLSNNDYKQTRASIRYIRETDYQKFTTLKQEKHLGLSDYASIWKVIIYLLISQQVFEKEGKNVFLNKFTKLKTLQGAIDEYYNKAFSPEITQALQFVQESSLSASLISKHATAAGEEKEQRTFSDTRFQTNLFYIQKSFEDAFRQIRLKTNHILFIDGIDIRPASIAYTEYLECIKGLANAIWEVNNDFFPTIKDGGGRLRSVLLVRPDIFASIGLQNQNTKIRDNSVFLDWRTEYAQYRTSQIFRVVDHLLADQQAEPLTEGAAWNFYFPWDARNIHDWDKFKDPTSFLSFLRWSYYRPRDIITMLTILKEIAVEEKYDHPYFSETAFDSPNFKKQYSDYLLGEIKDHLTFYYSNQEYETFLKFFEFLKGKGTFTHAEYVEAFNNFIAATNLTEGDRPNFMSNHVVFLQFLYDLNIICYMEQVENDKPYWRWCFRERSYANISPKVKEGVTYQVFYGLGKALNLGRKIV